jgi:2-keto-4-pentenoate hydratase/2-oxohepta-3-ene-1,7-dioic acid hydratase in catechol pathway
MKLVNFTCGEEIRLGIKTARGIIDVAAECPLEVPATIEEVIGGGGRQLPLLRELAEKATNITSEAEIVYAPCVLTPEKIICVGLNYKSHQDECAMEIPQFPVIFSKFASSLAAHNEAITLPQAAAKIDYEAELVIVIGKEAVNVSREEALSYVFGYTAGNDLSARDLQLRTSQWLLGKTCDQFAPIGPCVVTADEIDPQNLNIECRVNGELRQSANTQDMIFDCATIVSYLSKHMTLKPGDIIFSGTPGGVILGYPEDKQKWLKAGDQITVTIENIGSLVNTLK